MTKFVIEPGFIRVLKNMDNKIHYALGEFVDNSIQSYLDNKEQLENEIPGYKPYVKINVTETSITIEDNCGGIAKKDEIRAFSLALHNPDEVGIGTFGMGMKISACWFSDTWTVESKNINETESKLWTVNVPEISVNPGMDIGPEKKPNSGRSFTKIELTNCRSQCIPRTGGVTQLKNHIADIYRWFILDDKVNFYYNDVLLDYKLPHIKEMPLYSDQAAQRKGEDVVIRKWVSEIPKLSLGENENGELWIKGLVYLRKHSAGKNQKGFSIFWKNRLLEGMVGNTWMPGGPTWQFNDDVLEKKCAIYAGSNRGQNIFIEGYLHTSPHFNKSFQTNALDWEGKKNLAAEKLKEYLESATIYGDESGEKFDFWEQSKKGLWRQKEDDREPDEEEDDPGIIGGDPPIIFGDDDDENDTDIDISEEDETDIEPEEPDAESDKQKQRNFNYNGIKYKTTIFLDQNKDDPFFTHNDGPRRDENSSDPDVQTLQIRVNLGHAYIENYFSKINGEDELEGLMRFGVAFVLAERLAINRKETNRAAYVSKIFNKIIDNPEF
jgi:hypothetical protein